MQQYRTNTVLNQEVILHHFDSVPKKESESPVALTGMAQ